MSGGTTAVATATAAGAGAATLAEAAAADATFTAVTAGGASTFAGLSTAATLASGAISAVGSIEKGQASSAAAKYNAGIAQNNATIAQQNATFAGQEGEQNAAIAEGKTRAQVGAITAAQAANGVEVNSGSALDVRSSAAELGELNAINIRANAARQAYGFQTEATSDQAQAQLNKSQAQSDSTAGYIGAGSTLLSAAGNKNKNYSDFLSSQSGMSVS